MTVPFNSREDCCGCTACFNACPKDAISMKQDEEGFLYPDINEELCIKCNKCKLCCPFHDSSTIEEKTPEPLVYAIKHKNNEIRNASTSGGLFTAISDSILHKDGIVYGVKFDSDFRVIHAKAGTPEERDRFIGSKYVQSDLGKIYSDIKDELAKNRYVLFTGTPCQTAGLYNYLSTAGKTDCEKLFLCDLICHGVPSPLMWNEHILTLEKKEKSRMINYECRSKVKGWHGHNERCYFENGKDDYKSKLSQNHKDLFYSHLIIRPSCFKCRFTCSNRPADITIADFWGIEEILPAFDDNKGISLAIINTQKGRELFENIKEDIIYVQSSFEEALKGNHNSPARTNPDRDRFWNEYKEKGYIYVLKKYVNYSFLGKVKWNLKNKARKILISIGVKKI